MDNQFAPGKLASPDAKFSSLANARNLPIGCHLAARPPWRAGGKVATEKAQGVDSSKLENCVSGEASSPGTQISGDSSTGKPIPFSSLAAIARMVQLSILLGFLNEAIFFITTQLFRSATGKPVCPLIGRDLSKLHPLTRAVMACY